MTVTRLELEAAALLRNHRWAALATVSDDGPAASMVAYAYVRDLSNLVMFVSGLSEHTRNLIQYPSVALTVSEPDSGTGDPQLLKRVGVKGLATVVERNTPGFEDSWQIYVERFPDAAPRFVLADFLLIKVAITEARYVGGFAQAGTISVESLSAAALEF